MVAELKVSADCHIICQIKHNDKIQDIGQNEANI